MGNKSIIGYTSQVGANVVEDVRANLVFTHETFSVSKRFQIPNGAIRYIIIDARGCDCDFTVFGAPTFKAFGAGTITIDVYKNPIYTAGTEWVAGDRNFNDPLTPNAKFYFNTTVTDPGTLLPWEWEIFSNGTAAVSRAGGESSGEIPIIPSDTDQYMFKLTNLGTATARCTFSADFFEVNRK